jgi:hypothetical protein
MGPKTFLFFFVTTALIVNLPGYSINNAAAINVSDQQPMADSEEPDEPFTGIPNMTIHLIKCKFMNICYLVSKVVNAPPFMAIILY